MKLKLTDNLFLKVLSVLIAILLWIVVVNVSDAESSDSFNVNVSLLNTDIVTDNGKVFRVEEGTDVVKVTVRARASVLDDLKQSDFILTADMEKDLKYDSLVGITVECKNRNVNVAEDVTLDRSNVKVSIEDSATEQFPVQVTHTGTENEGLVVGSMVPEQTVIKISGPVSIVERIEKVQAVVDVTGLPATSVKTCTLRLYDAADQQIDTTYLNYVGKSDGIDVTVSMLHTKMIPLMFTYSGTPKENYKVKDIDWKPELVEIAGNQDVLATLTSLRIPSEAINVEGIDEELQLVVDVTPYLPSGVILRDETGTSVLVIVEVEYVEPAEEDETEGEEDEKTEDSTSSKPTAPSNGTTDKEDSENNQESAPDKENPGTNDSTDNSNSKDDTSIETDNKNQNNQETESGENDKTESNS